jgi:ribokinase
MAWLLAFLEQPGGVAIGAIAPHIVVVGSTMIDLLVYADPVPARGQTVFGDRFVIGHGGKGANQAVMAARLGSQVTFINRVGSDVFGGMARTNLADRGIDVTRVRIVTGESTGVATIWVEGDGTNRIIIVPGANQTLSADDVAAELAGVPPADCIMCQLEVPADAVKAALRWGRACEATTILNPAPAAPLNKDLLELVDWLIPNETEFEGLFGSSPDDERLLAVDERLTGGLVATLGERGAAAVVDGAVVHVEPPAVEAVDTTGAGDAFMGGLAYSLSRGDPVVVALAMANRCGALSTTKYGTQTSFPDAGEVMGGDAPMATQTRSPTP